MEDPEIVALLKFEPAPRKLKKVNGWTPALQRRFIAKLAELGSPAKAAEALNRCRFGVEKLYKAEGAESFRAAWHRAIEIAEERAAARQETQGAQWAGVRPPGGVDRRLGSPSPRPSPPEGGEGELNANGLPANEEQMWELIHHIGTKFMRKVAAEREARLAGEIVAADFYLRQITMIEVTLDLMSAGIGWDAQEVLRELRRGEHGLLEIAATPLSDWMDRSRREWWRQEGEPERPPHPDARFLERHRSAEGDYATEVDMYAGAWAKPPSGVSEAEWRAMTKAEQQAVIDKIRAEDAEAQRAWESRAVAEHNERTRSDK